MTEKPKLPRDISTIDETYGASDSGIILPKSDFPKYSHDPRHVYAAVRDELMLDGNARQNLATFCQTWEEPEVHQLMDDCIDKNMVDPVWAGPC